jgi:predicted  nucleic acid-binding Zn-ribbon protein
MSINQVIKSIENIRKNVNYLTSKGNNDVIKIIEIDIQQLSDNLNKIEQDYKNESKMLEKELKELNKHEVELESKKRNYQIQANCFESEKQKLNREKLDLEKEIVELNYEIREKLQKIEQEDRKRKNAVVDTALPLLFGPIGYGLNVINAIKDNEPERLIPFYSFGNGLISVLSQEKEDLERKCNHFKTQRNEISENLIEVEEELDIKNQEINEISLRLINTKNKISAIQKRIQNIGKESTNVKNILMNITQTQDRFILYRNDLSIIKECIESGILCNDQLKEFARNFTEVGRNFIKYS